MPYGLNQTQPFTPGPSMPVNTNVADMLGKSRKDQGYIDWVKGMGLDPNGNNELGQMFRKGGFGLAGDFYRRIGLLNELGPQRDEMIRRLMSMFGPGNLQNAADQNRARLLRQGNDAASVARARVRGMGGSADAQMGAALAQQNKATENANQYQNDLYSPKGQMDIANLQSGAFNQAQDLGLGNLMPLFQAIEARYRQNAADKAQGGLGGILGQIGGLAGMIPGAQWAQIFGGGHQQSSAPGFFVNNPY